MIRVESLSVRAGVFSLRGLSLDIPDGCYAVLMGRTAGGKTNLLESL